MKTIGVVGCGVMGAGIVQLCLQAGYEVVAREINDDLLKKGLKRVRGSLQKMAAKTSRPGKFVGLHFFNPATVMPLVEVIKTIRTEPEVFQTAFEFAKSLKKTLVVAKDNTGFIVNLLLTHFLVDAITALQDGVASTADIDAGMKLGCNHPMGPLMLADFIGIDVLMAGANSLYEEYKEKRYAPPALMKRMVTLGLAGAKTGRGFGERQHGARNPLRWWGAGICSCRGENVVCEIDA